MTEVTRLAAVFAVPIVGELDERGVTAGALALFHQLFVFRRGQKNERVAVFLVDSAAHLFEPELVAVEVELLNEVANALIGAHIPHDVPPRHRTASNRRNHRSW